MFGSKGKRVILRTGKGGCGAVPGAIVVAPPGAQRTGAISIGGRDPAAPTVRAVLKGVQGALVAGWVFYLKVNRNDTITRSRLTDLSFWDYMVSRVTPDWRSVCGIIGDGNRIRRTRISCRICCGYAQRIPTRLQRSGVAP